MAKSRLDLRSAVSRATGRRRKKPANPIHRAFDDVKQLVSDTGDKLFSRSEKAKAGNKQAAAKKTAATRKQRGQQRQAAAKKVGASRIRGGQQRQAATKKATRASRAKSR